MIRRLLALSILLLLLFLTHPIVAPAQKRPEEVKPESSSRAGRLMLYSCPVGASIYLNDRLQGKYQLNSRLSRPIELKPGRYRLKTELPEHDLFTQEVIIEPDKLVTVEVKMPARFGNLELKFSRFNQTTTIKIDDAIVKDPDYQQLDNPAERLLSLKLPLGRHELKIDAPGYRTFNTTVEIRTGENLQIPIALEMLPTRIKIDTQAGARVYLNNQQQGVVPANGRLEITAYLQGKTSLLVEHNYYESYQAELDLSSERDLDLTIKLPPKLTSAEFADNFEGELNLWQASQQWQTEKGLLHVRGARTIGMPKDRYYCDAEIVFGLRLIDSRGAGWVVHALDEKNYYLFYLNGPTGAMPNKFQTYICHDGKFDPGAPAQVPLPIIPALEVGRSYRIHIHIKGNTITHEISSDDAGEDISLGFFEDPANNFACGNFGFITLNNEDFQIHGFAIKPGEKR